MKITFEALSKTDIQLMLTWFNTLHVQEFYSLRQWTEAEVEDKLMPYITGEKPVKPYIIKINDQAIGYVQCYRIQDFPWPDQDLSDDIVQQAAGIDFFIGEPEYLGKGYGTQILEEILSQLIWPEFNYCVVDPDIRNKAMIRCNEKVGFKPHKVIYTQDALGRDVILQLMLLHCNIKL